MSNPRPPAFASPSAIRRETVRFAVVLYGKAAFTVPGCANDPFALGKVRLPDPAG